MLDYEKLYKILFNGITDALESLEKEDFEGVRETLVRAQQEAEDYYIEGDDEDGGSIPVYVLPHDTYSDEKSK